MVSDLVSDGSEALLVPVGDVAATATAIDLVRSDPDVAAGLGAAGRRKVVLRLDSGVTAPAAGVIYESLLTRPRPRRLSGQEIADLNADLLASDSARWRERANSQRSVAPVPRARGNARIDRSAEVAHVDLGALMLGVNSRILDLGCGTGQFSLPLLERRRNIISADVDAPRLAELRTTCAERKLQGALLRADGAHLPVPPSSFDAVVCREMLEHVAAPGEVLEEIWRVLKPDGRLCVSVPSAHTERWFQRVDPRWLDMAGHVNVFTRDSMCALLESHGFHVLEIRGRNFFYTMFWFFHTFAKTTHDGTGRIQQHFRLASWIFRSWRLLGEGRLKRCIEAIGDRSFPKSYFYYCEKSADAGR
jgi:SAM-dependent methyltransferase